MCSVVVICLKIYHNFRLPEVESDKTNWEYDVKLTNIDITEKK